MKIHNLYTDDKGESHFRDIEIDWAETRRGSKLSKKFPATGVIFRETEAEQRRLAPGAAPAVHRQPGRRGEDHRQ